MTRLLGASLATLALVVPSGVDAGGGPPSLVQKCGDAPGLSAQRFWITTSDGVRLYAKHGWGIVEDAPYPANARALILARLRGRS